MRRNRIAQWAGATIVVAIIGILTNAALAQSVSRTLVFSRQATLGGQKVQPGKYSIAYDEKKDGDVIVGKDGKEILKTPYKLVELPKAPADTAIVFVQGGDGSFKVRRIEVKGSKMALVFD